MGFNVSNTALASMNSVIGNKLHTNIQTTLIMKGNYRGTIEQLGHAFIC